LAINAFRFLILFIPFVWFSARLVSGGSNGGNNGGSNGSVLVSPIKKCYFIERKRPGLNAPG
jgi:hypothetical protein